MNIRFGELHPLENSLVLQSIFEHCTLKNLKSCRLVSRLWRDSSRTTWRSSAVATIDPNEARRSMLGFSNFSTNYSPHHQDDIQQVPFINYHLRIEDSTWFYDFWGSSVKVLTLESLEFSSQTVFLKTIFNCLENLEKLVLIRVQVIHAVVKETVEDGKIIEQIDWNNIQVLNKLKSICLNDFKWERNVWIEFLGRIPSLQALSLIQSVSNLQNLFQSLKTIREQTPHKLILKQIYLQKLGNISPAVLPVLLDSRLNLESVEFRCLFFRDFSNSLPKIIDNNAHSLKKLVLSAILDDTVINDFRLPSLKQLESLQELSILHQDKDYPLVNFLKVAPNLRKIMLRSSSAKYLGIEDAYDSDMQDIQLNYCSALELHVPGLTISDLEHLIRWTPNLKKLKVQGLNNQMFAMVCNGWSKLERLDILHSTVDDSGITGLNSEDVVKMNKIGKRGSWKPNVVSGANITSLKDLQRLNLNAAPLGRDKRNLGYCAVTHGIDLLPNLKHLKIQNFNLKGRPQTAWQNLFDRFPWPEDEK